jgi:hypothetical protein
VKYPGVQKLIDALKTIDNSEKSEMGFDMEQWYLGRGETNHPCGTACCLAGWATYLLLKDGKAANDSGRTKQYIVESNETNLLRYCEIDGATCDRSKVRELCIPGNFDSSFCEPLSSITLAMGIRALENFRDTGDANWSQVWRDITGEEPRSEDDEEDDE